MSVNGTINIKIMYKQIFKSVITISIIRQDSYGILRRSGLKSLIDFNYKENSYMITTMIVILKSFSNFKHLTYPSSKCKRFILKCKIRSLTFQRIGIIRCIPSNIC